MTFRFYLFVATVGGVVGSITGYLLYKLLFSLGYAL